MRITNFPFEFGGEVHSGWLPPNAAIPLPTPIQHVLLDIEIQFDGFGYLLLYSSQDGSISGDTWHQTMAEAQQAATQNFGVQLLEWQQDSSY
ncbi:MAG: hypothetical protein JWM11_7404 [Planctomycetaceae bacterium]|nr:hypothetical protein [Planctomycetaceae bacterium]